MTKDLTAASVKAIKGEYFTKRIPDGKTPGLCLVVGIKQKDNTASKSWAFRYTSPTVPDIDKKTGKQKVRIYKKDGVQIGKPKPLFQRVQMTIGHYPDMPLSGARDEAHELRKQVQACIDPALVKEENEKLKRQEKIREAAAGSVADLFTVYLDDLRLDNKGTEDIKAAYKLDIDPYIGSMAAKDVTHIDIIKLLSVIDKRGSKRKVDLVRGYLHRAFELGLEVETSVRWIDKADDFGLVYNPVARVKRISRPVVGDRALTKSEVQRFWKEAGVDCMQKDMALAIKLLLSTGQRVQEVLSAEWKEFDLDDKVWAIPMERRKLRNKAQHSEPHLVPLTAFTIDLLTELRNLSDSKFLFPDATGEKPKHYRVLSKTVDRFCKPAAQSPRKPFDKFAPRDCRRTFKTLTGSIGLSKEVRDRIQAHALSDVSSRHYDRYDYLTEKREAMEAYNEWLSELVDFKPADVVDIRAAK